MQIAAQSRYRAPALTADEMSQRRRSLAILLWITLGAALVLGAVNYSIRAIPETIVLLACGVLCVPTLLLNQHGRYLLASGLTTLILLATIVFNMYVGQGVHDSAAVAVPIFVMFGPLLYGRRGVPAFMVLGTVCVVAIAMLEMTGVLHTTMQASIADAVSLTVLVLCAGILVWVIMGNLEGNLYRARESETNLRVAYERTLEGWAKALEYRDPETEGHSWRVVDLCMRLAQEWGFNEDEMQQIRRGALLHDIGKMAIPDDILRKNGPLSASEWEMMRRHTVFAKEMLQGIPYLSRALSIPYSHHEHWDGSGYPRGLKGRQIPIQARIFAVADMYDALTSSRPYRRAWPKRKALAHIASVSGKVLDPEIAAVFLRLYEQRAFGRDA